MEGLHGLLKRPLELCSGHVKMSHCHGAIAQFKQLSILPRSQLVERPRSRKERELDDSLILTVTQIQIVITQIGKSGMNPSPRLVQCPTRAARLPLIRDRPPLAKRFRQSLYLEKPRKQRDLMLHQGLHFQSNYRSHKAKTRRSTWTKTRRISCLSFTQCNCLVATIT